MAYENQRNALKRCLPDEKQVAGWKISTNATVKITKSCLARFPAVKINACELWKKEPQSHFGQISSMLELPCINKSTMCMLTLCGYVLYHQATSAVWLLLRSLAWTSVVNHQTSGQSCRWSRKNFAKPCNILPTLNLKCMTSVEKTLLPSQFPTSQHQRPHSETYISDQKR